MADRKNALVAGKPEAAAAAGSMVGRKNTLFAGKPDATACKPDATGAAGTVADRRHTRFVPGKPEAACPADIALADALSGIGFSGPQIRSEAEVHDLLALLNAEETRIAEQSKVVRERRPRPTPEPSVRSHVPPSPEERKELHDRWTQYAMAKSVISKRLKQQLFDEWARVKGDSMAAEQFKVGDNAKLVRTQASWKLITPSVDIYIGDDAGFKKVLDCLYTRNGFDEFCALLHSEKQRTSWLREFEWLDPTHFRRAKTGRTSSAEPAAICEGSRRAASTFLTEAQLAPSVAWTSLPPIGRRPTGPAAEEMRASAPPSMQASKRLSFAGLAQRVQIAHRVQANLEKGESETSAKVCAWLLGHSAVPQRSLCSRVACSTLAWLLTD
jgi:hypothetical protein